MRQNRQVEIRKKTRIFDDLFKIDEVRVRHQRSDGGMSAEQRRLVFERGDSAAVFLLNTDSQCAIAVDQFRAPTLGKGRAGGWVTETVAGMIERHETPEATAIRETLEETGYKISHLQPIARFFSSPGGTSECIYLYYAEVRNADKIEKSGGNDAEGEDIQVKYIPLDALFAMAKRASIEDPKLLIGALWLSERMQHQ